MIQHQVTGQNDQSLSALARLYGVGWKNIGNATFGTWGASTTYPWLRDNGGSPGASANVPTGRHWFFSPGMVVNVPTDRPSKSPPDSSGFPGGPKVVVAGQAGDPLPPAEPAPDQSAYAANEEAAIAAADEQSGMVPPGTPPAPETTPAKAIVAGMGWMELLILGAAAYFLYIGYKEDKKPKRRRKKRKPTRRRKTRRKRRR